MALLGCGGKGAPKPLSDSEFVTKANAICADVYKQYADADFDAKAGVLTNGADRLRALTPPVAKQHTFERFLKAVDAEAGLWKEMVNGGSDLTDRFLGQESRISSTATAMGTKKCTTVAGKE
jgi:hypothetical protein